MSDLQKALNDQKQGVYVKLNMCVKSEKLSIE